MIEPSPDDIVYPVTKLATVVDALAAEGIPAQDALAGVRLSGEAMSSPATRISLDQVIAYYRNFQVLWEDGELIFCRGVSHANERDRSAVLVVLPATEHPTPATLNRLAHEYGLRDELDGTWAVRPLELISESGRSMLVLEDPGGEPLDRLLGAPMEVERFLRLAIGIAVALGKLHERGLVHKDIKPVNILVNDVTGAVKFTGFGIASRLARERQAPGPPEMIAGTLAYMAPEQTGRMNRSVDSRSDLYALGVTLYELLTGALPFTVTDPIHLIHCHIAREPVPPGKLARA